MEEEETEEEIKILDGNKEEGQGLYLSQGRALANDTWITKARTIHPEIIDRR